MDGVFFSEKTQTIKDSFENSFISSITKPNLIEIDRGEDISNIIFQNFLNNKNNKHYGKFDRAFRDLLKRQDFERGEGNWIDVLPTITKQYTTRVHFSFKLTPIQASLRKRKKYLQKFITQTKENKTKVSSERSCASCRFKENFSKG